jgi:uncharacterized protein
MMVAMTDSSSTSPSRPPAGWYRKRGTVRWWDGNAWGPEASPTDRNSAQTNPVAEGRPWSAVCHLSFFLNALALPVVPVLLVRFTVGRKNAFIRHHSTEALNFQLTCWIAWLSFNMGLIVAFRVAAIGDPDPGLFIGDPWTLTWFGVTVLSMLVFGGLSIFGAARASQGRWWRYPVSLPLIPGTRPRRSELSGDQLRS